jgi:hypothetical protein
MPFKKGSLRKTKLLKAVTRVNIGITCQSIEKLSGLVTRQSEENRRKHTSLEVAQIDAVIKLSRLSLPYAVPGTVVSPWLINRAIRGTKSKKNRRTAYVFYGTLSTVSKCNEKHKS